MAIAAVPELVEEGGATASKAGLTGAQKAGALSSALPRPKTSHPYIVGISLIVIGGFGLIGSITGTLPSMIAALFVPSILTDSTGGTPSNGILQDISNIATTVIDPLNLFN